MSQRRLRLLETRYACPGLFAEQVLILIILRASMRSMCSLHTLLKRVLLWRKG